MLSARWTFLANLHACAETVKISRARLRSR
jgi:hypothetical protein